MEAYLDIETTGLDPTIHRITVVGLLLGDTKEVMQWYGPNISADALKEALRPATLLYTFNGARFDLPFIRACLRVNVQDSVPLHRDLMLLCRRNGIHGGLKTVEQRLGIARLCQGITGIAAVSLWKQYESFGNQAALQNLLDYNREDVINLRHLKNILSARAIVPPKAAGPQPPGPY